MPALSPVALTLTLAFSPYAVGSLHASAARQAAEPTPEEAAAAPGWDVPAEGEGTEPGEEPAAGDADPAGEDAAAPEHASPEPAPGPEPLDPAAAIAPPVAPATPPALQPAPPPPTQKGIGLMIGSGVTGALAWAVAIRRMTVVDQLCDQDNDALDCAASTFGVIVRLPIQTVGIWTFNATTYGLVAGAGAKRGKYEAGEYMYSGKYDRRSAIFTGVGAGLLGVGVIAKGVVWGRFVRGRWVCPVDASDTSDVAASADEAFDCTRGRLVGLFAGSQLASAGIATGAFLLAHGIAYGKNRRLLESRFFRAEDVSVTPSFSREFAGLSVSGRF